MTKTSLFQIEVFLSMLAPSAKGLKFYKQEKNIEYNIFTFLPDSFRNGFSTSMTLVESRYITTWIG